MNYFVILKSDNVNGDIKIFMKMNIMKIPFSFAGRNSDKENFICDFYS